MATDEYKSGCWLRLGTKPSGQATELGIINAMVVEDVGKLYCLETWGQKSSAKVLLQEPAVNKGQCQREIMDEYVLRYGGKLSVRHECLCYRRWAHEIMISSSLILMRTATRVHFQFDDGVGFGVKRPSKTTRSRLRCGLMSSRLGCDIANAAR